MPTVRILLLLLLLEDFFILEVIKTRLMQWFSVEEVVYFVRVCESHGSEAWKEITGRDGKEILPFYASLYFDPFLSDVTW